jgi:hypothetical protein
LFDRVDGLHVVVTVDQDGWCVAISTAPLGEHGRHPSRLPDLDPWEAGALGRGGEPLRVLANVDVMLR